MSLDDLAQATKLRASILSAMEQDDFSHCGGVVYARGSCAPWRRSWASIPTTSSTRSIATCPATRSTDSVRPPYCVG